MTLASVKSDFDVPVGVKLTGVDNSTYSLTGENYSAIIGPNTESNTARVLQKDDVALAYEFSRKFPGCERLCALESQCPLDLRTCPNSNHASDSRARATTDCEWQTRPRTSPRRVSTR